MRTTTAAAAASEYQPLLTPPSTTNTLLQVHYYSIAPREELGGVKLNIVASSDVLKSPDQRGSVSMLRPLNPQDSTLLNKFQSTGGPAHAEPDIAHGPEKSQHIVV
jgi:hypothetical protein